MPNEIKLMNVIRQQRFERMTFVFRLIDNIHYSYP